MFTPNPHSPVPREPSPPNSCYECAVRNLSTLLLSLAMVSTSAAAPLFAARAQDVPPAEPATSETTPPETGTSEEVADEGEPEGPAMSAADLVLLAERQASPADALTYLDEAVELDSSDENRARRGLVRFEAADPIGAQLDLLSVRGSEDPYVVEHQAEIDAALEQSAVEVYQLRVRTEPERVTLFCTLEADSSPCPAVADLVILPAGSHRLIYDGEGYEPAFLEVEASAGGTGEATLRISVVQPEPEPEPEPEPVAPPTEVAPPEPETYRNTLAGALLLGGAAVLIGGGVAAHSISESAAAEWNDDACLSGNQTREANCGEVRMRAENARLSAGILYGAGLALAVGGLFALLPKERESNETASIRCAPGLLSLQCTGQF